MAWEPQSKSPVYELLSHEVKDMMIAKQAILKSLIESGRVHERNAESEKLVLDWIGFIYRNGYEEWKAAHPMASINPESQPF